MLLFWMLKFPGSNFLLVVGSENGTRQNAIWRLPFGRVEEQLTPSCETVFFVNQIDKVDHIATITSCLTAVQEW